jgi:hypothetical protein
MSIQAIFSRVMKMGKSPDDVKSETFSTVKVVLFQFSLMGY